MFRELSEGVTTGEEALDLVATIEADHGLVTRVDENRMVLGTAYQNPAIMTARAALLMLSICPEMERLGRRPAFGHPSWQDLIDDLLGRFEHAYRRIERLGAGPDNKLMPLISSHQRSLIQLRLHLALVAPGHSLPATLRFAPCLELDVLDDDAVEALSSWLAETGDNGRRRGDANVIGSATKPGFIRSVDACRTARGVRDGYRQWRQRWFELDRYANEEGRRARVDHALNLG